MENNDKEWRLQGQEKYLLGKALFYKKYADNLTTTDHDHCEFCSKKFSVIIHDCLTEGYTTFDNYHWICENCYRDFKNDFKWTISKQ